MERRSRPLDAFGLADIFGFLSFLLASLCVGMTVLCCAGAEVERDPVLLAYGGALCGAVWCGGFGVVQRGTVVGVGLSWTGLFLSLLACFLGFMWLMFRNAPF